MDQNIEKIVEKLQPALQSTLESWIAIPSVKDAPAPGAPFGTEVRRALDKALSDAEAMGFTVRNFDGYCGDARMGPDGVNPLAILVHLDVVPVGTGWAHDPFGAEIVDGEMFGRGTSDDKGPAVAALYSMLAYKQAGLPLNREVRLIFGCDEESGWGCMDHYREVCDMPKTGFSPDASFPIINTEKGMLRVHLTAPYFEGALKVLDIHVGERVNVIPGEASALIAGTEVAARVPAIAEKLGLEVSAEVIDGNTKLFSKGIPGHAAYPEGARNAIGQLLLTLKELGVEGPLLTLADRMGMDYYGGGMEIACSDKTSGPLTCNMGILNYDAKDGLFATLDIRYPILANPDALETAIRAAYEPIVTVSDVQPKKPHHVSPNSKLIRDLLTAYNEVTGRPMECTATGGGTYARVLEEGVAFGCSFPEREDLAHQANEKMLMQDLYDSVKIFVRAIELLNA